MSLVFLAVVSMFALAFVTVGALLEAFAPDLLDQAAALLERS